MLRGMAEPVGIRRRFRSNGFGFGRSLSGDDGGFTAADSGSYRVCPEGRVGMVVQEVLYRKGAAPEKMRRRGPEVRVGVVVLEGTYRTGCVVDCVGRGRKWCRSGLAGWAGIGGIVSARPVEASGALGRGRACRSEWAEALLLGFRSIFDCSRAAMR